MNRKIATTQPITPDPCVPAKLRLLLAADRRAGTPFADAWERDVPQALALTAPRLAGEWRLAFEATADAWEAAYADEPWLLLTNRCDRQSEVILDDQAAARVA